MKRRRNTAMKNAKKPASKRRTKSSPNWSQLPSKPLQLVSQNLTLIFDYISFRSVCSPWRSAAKPLDLPSQLPLFVFLRDYKIDLEDEVVQLFSLSDTTKLCELDLPEPHNNRCIGSAHGWLLVFGTDPSAFLLNPFTSVRIELPPITTMPGVVRFDPKRGDKEYVIVDDGGRRCRKSCEEIRDRLALGPIISSNPSDGDCVLMVAICDYWKLAFCRPGDQSWTEVEDSELRGGFGALAYHVGKFYAIDGAGRVMACDVTVSPPKAKVIPSLKRKWDDQVYLVGSGVGLLLIVRYRHGGDEGDAKEFFDVFKMDNAGGKKPRWEMISSLDGEALFLSDDYGMSVEAEDFPGINSDCIYYVNPFYNFNEYNPDGHDVGVFHMTDGHIKMIHCYPEDRLEWKDAGWLRPTLH